MAIAKLSIDLEASLGQFETELKRIGTVADGLSTRMSSAFKGVAMAAGGLTGVGSFAILKSNIEDAISEMAGLKDEAERTGASIEKLSALKSLAKLNDFDFSTVTGAIDRLNKALHSTDDESKGAGKALAAIGLDIQKLRGLDPAEALHEIAKAQEEFADGSGKAAAMMAIFGKSGAQLIPYLKELAEQEKLVGKVTAEQAKLADEYEKNMKRLQASFSGTAKSLAGELLPTLNRMTEEMNEGIKAAGGFLAALNAGATINPFKSTSENLKSVRADLEEMERVAKEEGYMDEQRYNRKKAQLEMLKAAQRREALAGDLSANMDANDRKFANKPTLDALLLSSNDSPKGGKPASFRMSAEATEEAKAYAKAIGDIQKAALDAEEASLDLTKTQRALFDVMTSPAWAKMDENLRLTIVDEFAPARAREAATESQKATDEYYKNLSSHFAALDEEATKLERQAELYGLSDVQVSRLTQTRLGEAIAIAKANGASEDAIIFLEKELAARQKMTSALEKIEEKRKSEADDLGEFAKSGARNIQSAMADFLFDPFDKGMDGMLQRFGQTVQRMVAEAAAAQLAHQLFGDFGKNGNVGGLAATAVGWFGGASGTGGMSADLAWAGFANGGAFGDGEILNSPTVFKFADGGAFRTGVAGEAGPEGALPLKRMSNGKLGVYADGGSRPIQINVNVPPGSAQEIRRAGGAVARDVAAAVGAAGRYA